MWFGVGLGLKRCGVEGVDESTCCLMEFDGVVFEKVLYEGPSFTCWQDEDHFTMHKRTSSKSSDRHCCHLKEFH